MRLSGGREVCFACAVDGGVVLTARVVARGDVRSVLALPGFAQRGEMLVHNHPSGDLEPSEADLEVAALVHDDGAGFAIVNNDASELYVVVEVPRAVEMQQLTAEQVERDLGPGGPVAASLVRYEDRPSQRAMSLAVARLYNEGGIGLLEAGTGVGKSLGYLIPALRWAAANGERTVVSTNTINLQEQLVGKDLPFLAGALGDQPVRFAMLKGWRNYLCLLRLEQSRSMGSALFDEAAGSELATLDAWAARTRDGSLSDLPTQPRPEVWDEVSAEPDLCLRFKCQHFDRCFVYRARRAAAAADVIVVNHHLLLSDVAVRRLQQNWEESAVLPAYARLVIDEGHHLEEAAAAHLGASVSGRALARLCNRLERRGKGLLNALVQRLSACDDLLGTASLDLVSARLTPAVHAARERGALLFDVLDTWLKERGQTVVRLTEDFSSDPVWRGGLAAALDDLLVEIELLHDGLRLVQERMESGTRRDETADSLLHEMRAVARRLAFSGDALRHSLRPASRAEPTIRWVEAKGRDRNISVSVVPLDLAPVLREDLFKRVETAVITSATLAADDRFDFLSGRLGVEADDMDPLTAVYPSPFDYPSQALLLVPTDLPLPNADPAGHLQGLVRCALDLVTASDGGVFVLLTSHRDVRAASGELRARGAECRWPVLVHGEDARDSLLRRFRESESAVLLGTASFWEGVDVPGRALRGIVIGKLPFRVPTEPVTAAHCEAIAARGGDPFAEYMIPHAALRLKQGFGRLIRSREDRGAIVICDPRIATKSYGRRLLRDLPPARRVVGKWQAIRRELTKFYGAGGG